MASLDNIIFFPYYHRCHIFITCLNYDDQAVVLQVTYEHICANSSLKLDPFWEQKWMKFLRKEIPQKYSSYGHAGQC